MIAFSRSSTTPNRRQIVLSVSHAPAREPSLFLNHRQKPRCDVCLKRWRISTATASCTGNSVHEVRDNTFFTVPLCQGSEA